MIIHQAAADDAITVQPNLVSKEAGGYEREQGTKSLQAKTKSMQFASVLSHEAFSFQLLFDLF